MKISNIEVIISIISLVISLITLIGTIIYNYSDQDLEIEIQAAASNAMIQNDVQRRVGES